MEALIFPSSALLTQHLGALWAASAGKRPPGENLALALFSHFKQIRTMHNVPHFQPGCAPAGQQRHTRCQSSMNIELKHLKPIALSTKPGDKFIGSDNSIG
jgi:hypothetical protein